MGLKIILVSFAVFLLGLTMSMLGRGGGNFYVPVLIVAGISMNTAAANAQLILMTTSLLATLVFHQHRTVDWKLALIIDPPTDIMAFIGGYFAHHFEGYFLKCLFAVLLVIAAILMFKPVSETKPTMMGKRFGYWYRSFGQYNYQVNLWLVIPITAAVGFFAGMIGISGGSFKIPLMVLACGVPMRIAVGTSSAMVAVTACMGFTGHALAGDFQANWILPLVSAAAAGGILGSKISVKVKPHRLKQGFAYTTLAAAIFMARNAFV